MLTVNCEAVHQAALGKGGRVSSVILLVFEQPGIKVSSILSLFFYDRKDYSDLWKKNQNNFLWWKSNNSVIGLIPESIKVIIQRPLNMEKEHFK